MRSSIPARVRFSYKDKQSVYIAPILCSCSGIFLREQHWRHVGDMKQQVSLSKLDLRLIPAREGKECKVIPIFSPNEYGTLGEEIVVPAYAFAAHPARYQ